MSVTIRGTDNSASTPAVTGTDGDTGLYFPAANELALSTGGTKALSINSSQKVTVGTAAGTPVNLNIGGGTGGASAGIALNANASVGTYAYWTTDGTSQYLSSSNGSTGIKFTLNLSAPDGSMVIDSSGRVTMPFQPAFAACGAATSVSTSSGNPIQFDTKITALVGNTRSSGYNTSTYRFTAPVAGLYAVQFIYYATAGSYAQIAPYKNGAIISATDQVLIANTNGTNTQMTASSFIIELAVNDYIDIRPRSGYSLTMFGGHSLFSGYLIG